MKRRLLFIFSLLFSISILAEITIGPGSEIGTDKLGNTYYEEFQDWKVEDIKAVDEVTNEWDHIYYINDGYDDSRDIAAFYFRDENNNLYFRVDFYDLKLGAENANLNLYITIDYKDGGQQWLPDYIDCKTDHPWEYAICIYDAHNYEIYDANWNSKKESFNGIYINSELDSIELSVKKTLLNDYTGGEIFFNVFTTKDDFNVDGHSDITDAIVDDDRGYNDGILNGAVSSNDKIVPAKLAIIFHGNQPLSRNENINEMIFDPSTTNKTGFIRGLDTHKMFKVPVNLHLSGTLLAAIKWAKTSSNDPSDGPSFFNYIAKFIDNNQNDCPGSLIGGVWAEHIMPYFEGKVNQISIEIFTTYLKKALNVNAQDLKIMHVPERVIRQINTNLSPLNGHTFDDISNSIYIATYLDEITHMHFWFNPDEEWSGFGGQADYPYQHKIYKINGIYCFQINDREDQVKFWLEDNGLNKDSRLTFLQKVMDSDHAQITIIFDDWEAYAGMSFGSGENNNANQYHYYIRWIANHQWIKIVNLKDILDIATNPQNPNYNPNFVIDKGYNDNLPLHTYQWLEHATEDSYDNWYYNQSNGQTGNESDFYNTVPVLLGNQGDNQNDGTPIPSGKKLGDMNTSGTIIHDAWQEIENSPDNEFKEIAKVFFCTHIYETAWHNEDNNDYHCTNYGRPWPNPDTTWDDLSRWVLRHQDHLRDVGKITFAAHWLENVNTYTSVHTENIDIDMDGVSEYAIYNGKVLMIFNKIGGKCVLFVTQKDGKGIFLSPAVFNRYCEPGEEEYYNYATQCSLFKDAVGNYYRDEYSVFVGNNFISLTSSDGKISKTITLNDNYKIDVVYHNNTDSDLSIRLGLSPDIMDLLYYGQDHLISTYTNTGYYLEYKDGVIKVETLSNCQFNVNFSETRQIALTDQREIIIGTGDAQFSIELLFNTFAGNWSLYDR